MAQHYPIFDPAMHRTFTAFPIDKSKFKTLLRIHPLLLKDPKAFVRKADLPVRTIKPHTLSRGGMSGQSLTIDLLWRHQDGDQKAFGRGAF
jgi:hypothetical protein